ncbi:MAG TPA: histidine kinase dimerization/phosphoacceptor domain -containing protein, partial [Flavisolibacter sp.]
MNFCIIVLLLAVFTATAQPKNGIPQAPGFAGPANASASLSAANKNISKALNEKDFKTAVRLSSSQANTFRKTGDVIEILYYDSLTLQYARLSGDSALISKTLNNYAGELIESASLSRAEVLLSEAEAYVTTDKAELLRWHQMKGTLSFKRFRMDDAISYYKTGLNKAQEFENADQVMIFKWMIGHTAIFKGRTDSMHLVYEALDYFERNKKYGSASGAATTIAKSFQFSFNPNKALAYFQKAMDLAQLARDNSRVIELRSNIGDIYLTQKKYKEAEAELLDVNKFYIAKADQVGTATSNINLGRLYTETDQFEKAKACFAVADRIAGALKNNLLKVASDGYKVLLMAKLKDFSGADSLTNAAIKNLSQNVDKDLINASARKLKEGKLIPVEDEAKLANLFANQQKDTVTTLEMSGDEYNKLQSLNSYSGSSFADDSSLLHKSNQQLLRLETQYHTRAIADSLHLEKEQSALDKEKLKTRNLVLIGTAILLVLVSAGLWLQYRNRRRAERDKQRIELLQNEIHHRVKNNLAVINRLVDVAGRNAAGDVPMAALKTRIKSIELLHCHLYSNEAKTGNISLQSYFEDLCTAIAATFETVKQIHIQVEAN